MDMDTLREIIILNMSFAIARFEGFYIPNSVAQRNNNPGNLRSWGNNPIVDGYTKFQTIEDGWKALRSQINKNINRELTLIEFFAGKKDVYSGYAPSTDNNNPHKYAEFVGDKLGVHTNIPICQILQLKG